MNTVTIGVFSIEATQARLATAFRGEGQGTRISFASIELLWKVLAPKRWALLKAMCGQSAMTIREIACRVGRDVKAVRRDMQALLDAGVLDCTEDGRIVFPYDAVHVDFMLRVA
jgi:predicted transcriptional regulator